MSYLMYMLMLMLLPTKVTHHKLCCTCSAEAEKKCKYMEAFLERHGSFTPLCFSTDGMFGIQADFFFVTWLSGCLLSGKGHTLKYLAGFDQDFYLQYFRPLCCVYGVCHQD